MVKKVKLELLNCYGIDSLVHDFEFLNKNMPVLIYAPNGVMKNSLAKSLRKYANNEQA